MRRYRKRREYLPPIENEGCTDIFFCFLSFTLEKITKLILEFQTEDFILHKTHRNIAGEYLSLLQMFIRPSVISSTDLDQINATYPHNFLPLSDLNIGGRAACLLAEAKLSSKETEDILRQCINFLTALAKQLRSRLDLSKNGMLPNLSCLDSKMALRSEGRRASFEQLIGLCRKFKNKINVDVFDALNEEWYKLPRIAMSSPLSSATNVLKFWSNCYVAYPRGWVESISRFVLNPTLLFHIIYTSKLAAPSAPSSLLDDTGLASLALSPVTMRIRFSQLIAGG